MGWMNAAHDFFVNRRVVVINLDETSIAKAYGKIKGTVMVPSAWKQCSALDVSEHANKSDMHTSISYVAMVANDPLISAMLPQVLVSSRRAVNRALEQEADIMLGVRTHLWIRDSAWLTQEIFLEVLELLLDALEDYQDLFGFILLVDACRVHLSVDVANKLLFAGIRIVVVPAKLTWLLQPLDTHVFANFKNSLKKKLQAAAINSHDGQVQHVQWIASLAEGIKEVTQLDCSHAFNRNGLLGDQTNMKAVEQNVLSAHFIRDVGRQVPSMEAVAYSLGLKSVPWYDQVLGNLQWQLALPQHWAQCTDSGRPRVSVNVPATSQEIV